MKKFLFVTCLTPQSLLTDLRKDLHQQYINALLAQDNNNWTAYLLGEKDEISGSLNYIKCNGRTKEEKLTEIYEKIKGLSVKPQFIIRLDDDDLISKNVLSKVESLQDKYEVFTDRYQHMFDMYSGKSLKKEYPWWPSTLVMRYEDALCLQPEFKDRPLYACSHDLAFHKYYKQKKVFYSEISEPIYTRIFSPTSLSFNSTNKGVDINKYNKYLDTYGFWKFYSDEFSEKNRSIYRSLALKYFNTEYKNNLFSLHNFFSKIKYDTQRILKRVAGKVKRS